MDSPSVSFNFIHIMQKQSLLQWALLLLYATLCGCGGGGGGSDPTGPSAGGLGCGAVSQSSSSQSVSCAPGAVYVDPNSGVNDAVRGDIDHPFKTITFAISLQKSRTIALLDGSYTTNSGEQFPLSIPAGTTVVGVDFLRNGKTYPRIDGCGPTNLSDRPAAVILGDNSALKYISAQCPTGTGVIGVGSNYLIYNAIAQNSLVGMEARNNGTIGYSAAINNSTGGIYVSSNSSPTMRNNIVKSSRVGVFIERGASPNFVDPSNTTGMYISDNTDCGIRYFGDQDLNLTGTLWNKPETEITSSTQCSGGNAISIEGIGSITYLSIPNPQNTSFPGTQKIDLIAPTDNIEISNRSPQVSWVTTGATLTSIAIFNHRPTIGTAGIENTSDAVWFWQTGLGGGMTGQLSFTRGKTPVGGSFQNLTDAAPLETGRVYYWIIWETDTRTGKVINSSNIGTFRVRPS